MFRTDAALLFVTCLLYPAVVISDSQHPYETFYSRPDLRVPSLNVSLHDSRVSPGYIFIAPHLSDTISADSGPYIFDESGTLVWSGIDAAGGSSGGNSIVHGLHVCEYQDQDHLCFWRGSQLEAHGSGLGIIINQQYQIVKTIQSATATASADLHEFRLTAEGTALITVYHPRFHGGLWILDCIFQEIGLIDDQLLFEWSALDHIDPSESHILPAGFFGDGSSPNKGFDYFHMNSIDKNNDGDYLISSRHVGCIFKVSHREGSIIWRLNGDNSSYHLSDFGFVGQHHVRFREDSSDRTVLSMFNNNQIHYHSGNVTSTALEVEINHISRVVSKVKEFEAPVIGGITSLSMGSMVYLPNNNILVNWATETTLAEFLSDGTPVWFATLGASQNYRAFKSPWVGNPLQPPALWTYAKTQRSQTTFFVSWNGATEVVRWHFYSSTSRDGVYELVGSKSKLGFETLYEDDFYRPWALAEAIDINGVSLGNSTMVRTYVPDENVTADSEIIQSFPNLWGNDTISTSPEHNTTTITKKISLTRSVEVFLELTGIVACVVAVVGLGRRLISRPKSYTLLDSGQDQVLLDNF